MITGPFGLVDLARMTRNVIAKSLLSPTYKFNPVSEAVGAVRSTTVEGLLGGVRKILMR